MKALLFIPLLLVSVVGLFAQVPADAVGQRGVNENKDALVVAERFVSRLEAKDYDGAAAMMSREGDRSDLSPGQVKKNRIAAFKTEESQLNRFGSLGKGDLEGVSRRSDPAYPDSVSFYEVSFKYLPEQKPSGVSRWITVKKEGSSYVVQKYNNVR